MEIIDKTKEMTKQFGDLWNKCGHYYGSNQKKIEFRIYPITTNAEEIVPKLKALVLDSITKSISCMRTGLIKTSYGKDKHVAFGTIVEDKHEDLSGTANFSIPPSKWNIKNGALRSVDSPRGELKRETVFYFMLES